MTSENTCSHKWSAAVYSDYRAQLELFYQHKKDRECHPSPDEMWRWKWLHRSLMTRSYACWGLTGAYNDLMMEYEINDRQRVFLNGRMYRKQLDEVRFSGNSVLLGNGPYPASDWYRTSLIIEFIKRMMKIKELISNHLWVDYLLHENVWRRNYGNLRKKTYYEILSFLKSVENPYFFLVKNLPRNNGAIVDKVRKMSDELQNYIIL